MVFSGGYSTPVFGTGRQKLEKPSRNWSSKVFSKKSRLRMGNRFTASLRVIFPAFGKHNRETVFLMQHLNIKKGQSCLPH